MRIEFGISDKRPIKDYVLTPCEAKVLRHLEEYGSSRHILGLDTKLDQMQVAQGLVGLQEKGLAVNTIETNKNVFTQYQLTKDGILAKRGFTPLEKQRIKTLAINPPPRVRLTIQESPSY